MDSVAKLHTPQGLSGFTGARVTAPSDTSCRVKRYRKAEVLPPVLIM